MRKAVKNIYSKIKSNYYLNEIIQFRGFNYYRTIQYVKCWHGFSWVHLWIMYLYCIVIIVCKVLRFVAYIVRYAYNLSRLLYVSNEFTNGLIIPDGILYDTVIQVHPYDPDHRKVLITKWFVI